MPEFGTIAHLVDMAIQGERMAETFYQRVAVKFRHHPEIEQFWIQFAAEENEHARWLEELRKRSDSDLMNAKANPVVLKEAQQVISISIDSLLRSISTLQDAFEIANEMEQSETNAIFEFLIGYFTENSETAASLRTQLNDHVGRLVIEFPSHLGTDTLRRTIEAAKD